jgi:hypothetical protein
MFSCIIIHIGVHWNIEADNTAKHALQLQIIDITISYTNLKPSIGEYIKQLWQFGKLIVIKM